MDYSSFPKDIEAFLQSEFPHLQQKSDPIVYLDHAGASLTSKSQLIAIHKELTNNLICNPHTNFGSIKVGFQ
jgi:selenocysteine lyase/cysteine desulfurase